MSIEQENNDMLRNQIKEVAHHSSEIKKVVNKRTRVEPWVIAKTERAATDLSDVTHYLDGEKYGDGGEIAERFEKNPKNETFYYVDYAIHKEGVHRKFFETESEAIRFFDEIIVHPFSDSATMRRESYNSYGALTESKKLKDYTAPWGKFKRFSDGGSMFGDGGEIKKIGSFQNGDDTLIYMFDVNNVNPSFYHKLVGTIQKYDDNEYWATYENELWENLIEKTFKTFDEAKKWVFEKINLDKEYYIEYSMTGADKMSTGGSMYAKGGGVDNKTIIIENLEVYNEDLGRMSFEEANKKVAALGNGWRLPTNQEFKSTLLPNKLKISKVQTKNIEHLANFWSSSKNYGAPYYFYFMNGEEYLNFGANTEKLAFVLPVRNIPNSKYSEGGSMYAGGGEVSFTDYKGESIMFEPHFNEYYVGDAGPFSTMDEAKSHIDGGSPMSSSMRGAYERGLFARGGEVGIGMMAWRGSEAYHVVGYDESMDRWVFKSTTSGLEYRPKDQELKEFEFIKPKKMTEGGEIKVGDEFLNTERGEKFYIDKVDFSDKSYPFYVLKSSPNDLPEVIGRNEFDRYYKAGLYEKYALGGGVSSENAEKIAKLEKVLSSTLVPDSVKEKARMEIERLKSETTASDSGLSDEQRDLNKKAIAIVDKAKIVDFKALVSEALTDANYHSSAFKFAQLVDSSIKTKEDWYKAEDFEGDEKTRDAGIQIANMCGWDGDKITEALYFVLKMKGEHKLADALKKAMEVEEASYLAQETIDFTDLSVFKELVRNSSSFEEAFDKVPTIKGIPLETARYFSEKYNPTGELSREEAFRKFYNEIKGISEEPKSIRTAIEPETKPSIRNAVVEKEPKNISESIIDSLSKLSKEDLKKIPILSIKQISEYVNKQLESEYSSFQIPKIDYSKLGLNEKVVSIGYITRDGQNKILFYDIKGNVIKSIAAPKEEYIKIYKKISDEMGASLTSSKSIYDAYIKAKADGSNPELVKSIETLIVIPKAEEPKVEIPKIKEQPKVSDDRLKGKNISDVAKYVSHRNIESITFTIDGKSHTVKGSDIFDGIYVENNAVGVKAKRTTKAKQPKVTRTQFEEETFEYGKGGYARPNVKTTGVYEFAVKGGVYEVMVVGFERENETEDSLYFDDSNNTEKKELGSIIIKNSAWNKLSKGLSIMARSTTGIKGKLTRIKDLY